MTLCPSLTCNFTANTTGLVVNSILPTRIKSSTSCKFPGEACFVSFQFLLFRPSAVVQISMRRLRVMRASRRKLEKTVCERVALGKAHLGRSEEHTSELQSR